jgi:hypothetical protein
MLLLFTKCAGKYQVQCGRRLLSLAAGPAPVNTIAVSPLHLQPSQFCATGSAITPTAGSVSVDF